MSGQRQTLFAPPGPAPQPENRAQLGLVARADHRQCWAATLPELADITIAELKTIGIAAQSQQGGVAFEATPLQWDVLVGGLRTAEQVLARLGNVVLNRPGDVEDLWAQLRAAGWLPPRQVPDAVVHAKVHTTAKAAWLTHLVGTPPPQDREAARWVIHLTVHPKQVAVSLDMAGYPLAERGYRLEPGDAPLRPTLAAALLQWAGLRPGQTVWDPLCGSGTLAIEAALAGHPYRARPWVALSLPNRPPARAHTTVPAKTQVLAGDLDPEAVARTGRNAARAGVADQLQLATREMGAWPPGPPIDLVASNLPWGVRLGTRAQARRLAQRWAACVRRSAPGAQAAVVIAEPQLADELGLSKSEVRKSRNGGQAVWLVRGQVAGGQVRP